MVKDFYNKTNLLNNDEIYLLHNKDSIKLQNYYLSVFQK